jgi:cytochrome P450
VRPTPTTPLHINLPGFEYRRVLADMARADELVFGEIATRRADGATASEADVVDVLLGTRDEDGTGLSDQEVRDQTMSLIAAGHDTTSAGAAWAVYDVARDCGVCDYDARAWTVTMPSPARIVSCTSPGTATSVASTCMAA